MEDRYNFEIECGEEGVAPEVLPRLRYDGIYSWEEIQRIKGLVRERWWQTSDGCEDLRSYVERMMSGVDR